jgi:hypothetical protein
MASALLFDPVLQGCQVGRQTNSGRYFAMSFSSFNARTLTLL